MIKFGILGCSEIAYRRFLPSIMQIDEAEPICIAEEYDKSKLLMFCNDYKLEQEDSFESLICRNDIDAIYIPQPPALHYKWAKFALEHGKHVFVEKPSTTSFENTKELVSIAKKNRLALHENYMFQYHILIQTIKQIILEGTIGDVYTYRLDFGFPLRKMNDFRYNAKLGGGALLDCGGYPIKLATLLLGNDCKVDFSSRTWLDNFDVDMIGHINMSNSKGTTCQISYGMNYRYKCSLEAWGSIGRLYVDRVFTAPDTLKTHILLDYQDGTKSIDVSEDSSFVKSIENFLQQIKNDGKRDQSYNDLLKQSEMVQHVKDNSIEYGKQ